MTSRQWAQGELGGTPITAEKLNGIEADLDARIPVWRQNTPYKKSDRVVSPDGIVVTATADHTAGDAFEAARWQIPSTFLPASARAAANGVASLGSDSKIPLAQIPSISSFSQYGTFAARPAATGLGGISYYASDTGEQYRSNGTTWDTVGSGNRLGTTRMTTGFATASTTGVDVPSLSVVFVAGTRPVEISLDCDIAVDAGNNLVTVEIQLDGTTQQAINHYLPYGGQWYSHAKSVEIPADVMTPGTTHTAKVRLKTQASTARIDGNATKPTVLTVRGV